MFKTGFASVVSVGVSSMTLDDRSSLYAIVRFDVQLARKHTSKQGKYFTDYLLLDFEQEELAQQDTESEGKEYRDFAPRQDSLAILEQETGGREF